MTMPAVNIKSSKIVTKNVIHIIIVPKRRRKGKMATTSPSPVNKVKIVLKPV